MIDLIRIFKTFSLPRDGVVHVGSFYGGEIGVYESLGFASILFIEANPEIYSILNQNMAGKRAFTECVAITDREGQSAFYVTDNGQSSSVLTLKRHKDLHPSVNQVGVITVNTTTIDSFLEQKKYAEQHFSFLNIDIQGAELLAFKGAPRLLDRISVINCEVNFDELYEGTPHISAIDGFLYAFNFTRVETFSATRSWGDAIYVKNQFTKV
jgi:FkbM family methyltransferase